MVKEALLVLVDLIVSSFTSLIDAAITYVEIS
jgi:hypothetical protein